MTICLYGRRDVLNGHFIGGHGDGQKELHFGDHLIQCLSR